MVYFVQGETTGLIKIGQTDDVESRLRDLQAASPDRLRVLAVITDGRADHPFHKRFGPDWNHGEWFRPTSTLMEFIGGLPATQFAGLTVSICNRSTLPKKTTIRKRKVSRVVHTPRYVPRNANENRGGRPAKIVDLKRVCERRRSRESFRSIARSLGISHSTLLDHLRRAGLMEGFDW